MEWYEHGGMLKFKVPYEWTVEDSDSMTKIFSADRLVLTIEYLSFENETSFEEDCDNRFSRYIRENGIKVKDGVFCKYSSKRKSFAYCDGETAHSMFKIWAASYFPLMALGVHCADENEECTHEVARIMDSIKFKNAYRA
jgi:hypothetical protein